MKQDALSMTMLYDCYGGLLTEKQREYFDLYHNQDFSLAEIAENEGISRQGVHDVLSRTEKILLQFEEQTGIVAGILKRKKLLADLRETAAGLTESPARQKLLDLCDRLAE